MDAKRLVCALLLATLAASLGGCASTQPGADAAPGREEICSRLLRDLRLYCKDGVRGDHAATSMDCLSRRLEFEKACF